MPTIKKVLDNIDETALEQSYQEACIDKDFKKYINKLKTEDEILMKHTSNLKDAWQEEANCKTCTNLESCKNKIVGYIYTPVIQENHLHQQHKTIIFSYIACKKKIQEEKLTAYTKNIELLEMPKELTKASFKNIYKDDKARIPILRYFKDFMKTYDQEEKPKGLYLTGSFGSGKTYLIAALLNEMAKKGVNSILIYYPEFLRSLKASFQTDYSEKFNLIRKTPLLLLDDIGAENCSSWSRDEVLEPILQYRMENRLPTFFTSNLTLEQLEKFFSITTSGVDKVKARRIIERMKQLTIQLELVSKNRRE